ncbi:PAAR domain-containing protein [Luteibacter sp. 22Crub2.1]|uniref:PAAR domain-containing protein n=1 Tax=Luteibacter sp. 22Crub2.1 TaxID=1283288 RepID=UPI0009A65E5E|nr:PAAR domain-containing protein [Luteibacter sp. 22Crub2.1]SKB88183.1 Zn-binding Pro-Ala-Ala-Arg (PAAR) domain-containing protein, incolved in TypeVI secretion [Luteibacter sp. 22Crub2.1]
MSKPLIIVGDSHSHGGNVLNSSADMDIGGKLVACEGDEALCHVHGLTKIGAATSNITCGGRRVACDGDRLACGAVLKASQDAVDCF